MKLAVYRKAHFNAAHRLHSNALSDAENQDVFGKCNYPNYHGHNYEVVLKVIGEVDPITGYVIDLKYLKEILNNEVLAKFDHKNLNLDIPEFRNLNPTAENIAIVIFNKIRPKLESKFELKVFLYETERNFVEYPI